MQSTPRTRLSGDVYVTSKTALRKEEELRYTPVIFYVIILLQRTCRSGYLILVMGGQQGPVNTKFGKGEVREVELMGGHFLTSNNSGEKIFFSLL